MLSKSQAPSIEPDQPFVDICVYKIDYTEEYIGENKKPMIHIFGRDRDNNLRYIEVNGFEPYFYTTPAEIRANELRDDYRVTGVEGSLKTIRGKDVKRVYTALPRHVGKIKQDLEEHYEADILFGHRFMIDKGIESGIRVAVDNPYETEIKVHHSEIQPKSLSVAPRTLFFDIEVDDSDGFPENGEKEVLSIVTYDSYDDKYNVLLWGEGDYNVGNIYGETEFISGVETFQNDKHSTGEFSYEPIEQDSIEYNVIEFPNEEFMLRTFIDYIDEKDPDILTAWNIEFDMEYLIDRYDNLSEEERIEYDSDSFARVGRAYTSNYDDGTVEGRVVFDLLEAFKRTQFSELDSYRLEDVGQSRLGVGKETHTGDVFDLWNENQERLIQYNLRDVELMVELNEKEEIIPFWDELRKYVGCGIEEAPIPGKSVDMYVLQRVNGKKRTKEPLFVLPSKGQRSGEGFEGGAVFEPISGVKEYVSTIDLKSLYPMCMITINASPETKVDPTTYDGDTYVSPNGIHFRKDKDGIIKDMLLDLLEERDKKKELRDGYSPEEDEYKTYDRQQGAIKVVMNSLYGTLGWDRFRLYDEDVASSVTATGRKVIEHTERVTEEMGLEVTYGDTDSVLVSLADEEIRENIEFSDREKEDLGFDPSVTTEDIYEKVKRVKGFSDEETKMTLTAMKYSFELEDAYNSAYDDFAREELNAEDHRFLIEFEKLYQRFFQAGKKKRYAGEGIWKEGKVRDWVDVVGFETQRSDTAEITDTVQSKVLKMVVNGKDKTDIRSYLQEKTNALLNGELSPEKVGIPGGIGKAFSEYDSETAQVRGSRYANALLGTNIQQGDKPMRVYVDSVDESFKNRIVIPDEYDNSKTDTLAEKSFPNEADTIVLDDPEDVQMYHRFMQDIRDKDTDGVICFQDEEEFPEDINIDWERMFDTIMDNPLGKIINAIGFNWNEVKTGQEQVGLSDFS